MFVHVRSRTTTDELFTQYMALPDDGEENAAIFYDLRGASGRSNDESFEIFYNKLDSMLEEFGKAAEERRHGLATHMPFAVSVPEMTRKVILLFIFGVF